MPDLMIGARGASVEDIQRFLNSRGFTDQFGRPLRVDGIMGPRTEHALAAFQAANGITPNGVVDRTTAATMTGARREDMARRMPVPRVKPTGFSQPDMPVPRPRPRGEDYRQSIRPFAPGEFINNPDGSISTELSVTSQSPDGSWTNIPSLWMTPDGPMIVDEDIAADLARNYGRATSTRFPSFGSLDEAERIASSRSNRGGMSSGSNLLPVPRPRPGLNVATRGFQPEPPAEDVIQLETIPIEVGPYGASSFVDQPQTVAPGIRRVPARDPDSRLGHQGVSSHSDLGPRFRQMVEARGDAINRNATMTPEGRGAIYAAQRPSRVRLGVDRSVSPIATSRDISPDPWIADDRIRDYYPPELPKPYMAGPDSSVHVRQPVRRANGGRLLHSDVPGRTDRLPMAVTSDSYVIPADIVSALGQGNTTAGGVILDQIVNKAGVSAFAKGGKVEKKSKVPIIAAGGEYVVEPEVVSAIGNGDVRRGHDILDKMVRNVRRQTIRELQSLPGPAR